MSAVVKQSAVRHLSGVLALGALLLVALLAPSSASAVLSLEVTSLEGDAHETQALYVEATSGQFRLEFGSGGPGISETADIDANASELDVQSALNALANVKKPSETGSVSVVKGTLDGTGLIPYLVTFDGGPLATRLQPLMRAKPGTVPLAGSPPALMGGGPPVAHVETLQPGGVSRSYERIDYTAKIKNTSTAVGGEAAVGDTLVCNGIEIPGSSPAFPKNWNPLGFEPTQYEFRWLRNGVLIPGATLVGYTATAADAGAALQCIVKGTNATGASAFVSLPSQLVAPLASPPPPAPTAITAPSRPSITTAGADRTCNPPTNWTEDHDSNPATAAIPYSGTWEYQWLRNGEPIPGATTSTYTPDALGADKDKVLQCMARGKTGTGAAPGGGGMAAISLIHIVGEVPNAPFMPASPPGTPSAVLNGAILTAEVELPGPQSFVYGARGSDNLRWSCTSTPGVGGAPATAQCSTEALPAALAPGAETTLSLAIGLGGDLPSTASVEVSAGAVGASATGEATASFEVEPAREFGIMPGRFSARALGADGNDFTQAGGHPALANSTMSFWRDRRLAYGGSGGDPRSAWWRPVEPLRNAIADVPPGFIGNPRAIPDLCPDTKALLATPPDCPPQSIVGELAIASSGLDSGDGPDFKRMALFAIEPEAGAPAQFAAVEFVNKGIYVITPRLRPEANYAISIEALGVVQSPLPLLGVRATLCSYGSNVHSAGGAIVLRSCKKKGDPGALETPFLTTQTECAAPNPVTRISIDSWADPGDYKSAESLSPKMTGCELVPFEPQIGFEPTTKAAESASGLQVDLTVPSEGLEDPDGISQAHLKKTTVTLPEGMSVNPGAADGLAACTQAQLGMTGGVPNNDPVNCPLASKIGSAEVETPILEETLKGSVYLAKQGENPFGSLVALYVVVESKERGVLIKLAGNVEFKANGQIVSTFDENPQAPFSSLELDFHAGPRATLLTPQKCGSYEIVSELTPWSAADPDNPTPAETVTRTSGFQVTSGPNGSACPTGALEPKLKAGLQNPLAGASSPFVLSLSREDGSQRINGLDVTLPPGLVARLKGVSYCTDTTLASIPSAEGTGQAEIDNPSCPAASQVGSVSVGAGAGSPFYVNTGKAYLAGPYKGAPLSLAVVVPAVAGPFDLGNVVVRNALRVNPINAQVTVDSDPIPTQLHNVAVDVRDIRVSIDRPQFTQAPTSCEEMAIGAKVSGEQGANADVSNRFQVGECASLEFKPRLAIQLHGDTRRASYQRLEATLTARPGDANISRASVALPHSAFLAQEHIRTICTRVQFAADNCPKGAIYGRAEATSPLLDGKLSGPVYLRSSDNELPDLVVALRGPDNQPIEIELSGRTDSINEGIRNTFDVVPDAPVTSFKLKLFGGKKSLIINSRNLCNGPRQKATVKFSAHNGLRHSFRPVVGNDCGKKKGRATGKKGRG